MQTAEFRYVTTNTWQSGSTKNPIISELPFTNVNFTQQLNSVGTFQGEVLLSGINTANLNVYNGTVPGQTMLWVLYTDPILLASFPVWSGIIWSREYNSDSQLLSITAQEVMSIYQRRRISSDKTYSSVDPAYIARNLLQYTEGQTHGKTGMTYDSTNTGASVSKTYNAYEYKSVYQAIKDLSQNYFDFAVIPYWDGISGALYNQFTIGVPLGTTYSSSSPTAPVFQFPGNVISYRFPEDGMSAANKLYGLGYGANGTKLISVASSNTYIGSSGTWPLLEDSVNYIDISSSTLLDNVTKGKLKAISYPPTTVEVVVAPYTDPYFGQPRAGTQPSYNIGDEVLLKIQDDYFPSGLNLVLRVVALSVNPGENGPSRITLTLTRQLDAGVA